MPRTVVHARLDGERDVRVEDVNRHGVLLEPEDDRWCESGFLCGVCEEPLPVSVQRDGTSRKLPRTLVGPLTCHLCVSECW
mgnify:CR=1 FL=1